MLPKEILQKVHKIEITTSRLVNEIFADQYHSAFKGRGMEFDEVREYQAGDDVRTIDWNVSARTGVVHIKKYIEERELSVMILIDASRSCQFASVRELKSQLAAEVAAVLAFSAIRNNDKVGLMIFTDQIELFIPPRKGVRHVLRVIREVLYFKPKGRLTNLVVPLEYLSKVMSRKAVCFVISDFFEADGQAEPSYKKAMRIANRRHDLIAVTLNDPLEIDLPDCGLIEFEDAETEAKSLVDSGNPRIREEYHAKALERLAVRHRYFRAMRIDHIDISTDQPYVQALIAFFAQRRNRMILG